MSDWGLSVAVSLTDGEWPLIFDGLVGGCASSYSESDYNVTWQDNRDGESSSSSQAASAPAVDGAESEWEQWKVSMDIAGLCGFKQTTKHKAYWFTPLKLFSISSRQFLHAENVTWQEHKQVLLQGHSQAPGQVPKQLHQ